MKTQWIKLDASAVKVVGDNWSEPTVDPATGLWTWELNTDGGEIVVERPSGPQTHAGLRAGSRLVWDPATRSVVIREVV